MLGFSSGRPVTPGLLPAYHAVGLAWGASKAAFETRISALIAGLISAPLLPERPDPIFAGAKLAIGDSRFLPHNPICVRDSLGESCFTRDGFNATKKSSTACPWDARRSHFVHRGRKTRFTASLAIE